jgi:bifunctional DNA-binding transcriptional regulator/antitoxin component of YhaV-PrlF toxin-antitoxin module
MSKETKFYPARVRMQSEENRTFRIYIPAEIVAYLELRSGDTVAFMKEEEKGEKIAKMKKLKV